MFWRQAKNSLMCFSCFNVTPTLNRFKVVHSFGVGYTDMIWWALLPPVSCQSSSWIRYFLKVLHLSRSSGTEKIHPLNTWIQLIPSFYYTWSDVSSTRHLNCYFVLRHCLPEFLWLKVIATLLITAEVTLKLNLCCFSSLDQSLCNFLAQNVSVMSCIGK